MLMILKMSDFRYTPLDLASLNGHENLVLTVIQTTAFDVDRSAHLNSLLLSIITKKASAGLEQLCSFFLVCERPVALMLTTYEMLCHKAKKELLQDTLSAQKTSEVADLVSCITNGLIHAFDRYSSATLMEIFSLDAGYTPCRKMSTLDLAIEIPCRPVLASSAVQKLSKDKWYKKKVSARAAAWHIGSWTSPGVLACALTYGLTCLLTLVLACVR